MSAAALIARADELGLLGYIPAEVEMLYDTVAALRPGLIVEWGTNVGHSARLFVEARRLLELDCKIHSVEIGDRVPMLRPEEEGLKRGHHVLREDVTLHLGHGPLVALEIYHSSKRRRALFYIDDNHEYLHVLDELFMLAADCPQAVLLLHDTVIGRDQEPDRALKEFLDNVNVYETRSVPGVPLVALWPKTVVAACR